jgi:1,2-diacylglycerol 3-beta-galactosyltransferase
VPTQLRVLRRWREASGKPVPPFATVVTDLTLCHPIWFHPDVDACFVPTDSIAQQGRLAGLRADQIVMHGLPIRPAFAAPLPPLPALRQALGLARAGAVILLAGGGEGMGLLEPTAHALGEALPPDAQVVVICGRNAALEARLAAHAWRVSVHVKGFVSNMDEWMGAADVVITKAGPGTIAEALVRGVPIMLNGAIPCQEEGNVPYVVENGVGRYSTDPQEIAAQVAAWCTTAAGERAAMAERAKALGHPTATFDIVRDLAAIADAAAEGKRWRPSSASACAAAVT